MDFNVLNKVIQDLRPTIHSSTALTEKSEFGTESRDKGEIGECGLVLELLIVVLPRTNGNKDPDSIIQLIRSKARGRVQLKSILYKIKG